jgi:hypothetical protein
MLCGEDDACEKVSEGFDIAEFLYSWALILLLDYWLLLAGANSKYWRSGAVIRIHIIPGFIFKCWRSNYWRLKKVGTQVLAPLCLLCGNPDIRCLESLCPQSHHAQKQNSGNHRQAAAWRRADAAVALEGAHENVLSLRTDAHQQTRTL